MPVGLRNGLAPDMTTVAGGINGIAQLDSTGHVAVAQANAPKYNPRLAIYNLFENPLASWRNAYMAQLNNERQAKILIAGDSTWSRYDGVNQAFATSAGGRFRTLMETHVGSSCGTGLLGNQFSGTTGAPTITLAGSWSFGPTGLDGGYTNTAADTVTITFTAPSAGILRVVTLNSATGSTTSKLDTVTSTAITSTSANTIATTNYTISASGSHTLVLTNASGRLYFVGVNFLTNATTGVQVSNVSISGYALTSMTITTPSATNSAYFSMTTYAPDLLIVPLGTNDVGGGRTDGQIIADASTLAKWCAANHCSLLLVVPAFDISSTQCRADYRAVADLYPNTVCVLDLNLYTIGDQTSLSADGTHPTARGTFDFAQLLFNAIMSQMS